MKRKDFDEQFSSVYLSSTKSRRLDADIFPIRNEDPRTIDPHIVEHGLPQEPHSTSGSSMVHRDPFPVEICHSDEKALVLYNPINMPLFRSPASSHFSIILNSDLNPSLKADIFFLGKSKSVKQDVYEVCKGETSSCLAIVPWGQYHLPVASRGEAEEISDPMEAEQVETMDIDGCSGGTAFGLDAMDEGAARMLYWQQQQ